MGNLTNQYVSQSYQGILTLANANTGVTATLQSVQDGIGNNLPIKVSNTQVTITGSFFGDGSGLTGITVSVDTGSLVTTSSFNAYTSSNDSKVNSLIAATGSLQNQINQKLDTGSFNTYTSSNDNRVNSLINSTGSYATTSSLTALSQSIASTDLAQNNRLTSIEGVTGSFASTSSLNSYTLTSSFNAYTSSNDGKVNSLISKTGSYATTGSNNFVGQQNINGSVNVTGSVNITGNITATSASFTYVNTVYETASVIYSSGSNQFGDASDDTQTLWGKVNLPSGPLVVTGSIYSTDIIGTGSLFLKPNQSDARFVEVYNTSPLDTHITASGGQIFLGDDVTYVKVDNYGTVKRIDIVADNGVYISSSLVVTGSLTSTGGFTGSLQGTASNAVSSSQAQNAVSASQAANAVSASQAQNAVSASYANDFNRTGLITTGSAASSQSITGSLILSGSAGVELDVKGDVLITGSVILSGSAGIELDVKGDTTITGSLGIRSGSLSTISNNTTVNIDLYLTSSLGGQSNIIRGWNDNPTAGGPGTVQANYTSSLRITGSNNIVSMPQIRATGLGGGADLQGYISGSGNIVIGNNAGIYLNTGSLLFPKIQSNIVGYGSAILMNFTTSSLSGGHPTVSNNILMSGIITLNSNSGSITNVATNAVLGGAITSTQNFVTNTRPNINSNNVIGNVTLNHISSSISYQNNYNNAGVTINNHLSSSNITNNGVSVTNNAFIGGAGGGVVSIWVSGSQSSNATRNIQDNLIGGKNIIISSSFVSSSNSSLIANLIYGQNLTVSGSNSTTVGGSAFLGRYNGLSGLEDTQNIVFAVGTGTGTSNRRTGLWITSGSLVGISGSMAVTGALSITGSDVNIKGITQETGSFVVTMDNTGSLHYAPFSQVASLLFNEGQFAQTGTLTAASGVSGSVSYDISGSVNGITLVSGSRLTIPAAGVYNIQFSAQWDAASGADTGWAWFKKNGTNIANSNSKVQLPNNTSNIMTVNILETAAVGDYYEVAWQNNAGHARLLGEAASGNYPAIPSVITTITQVN